jgi:hypothetical protein
MATITPMKMIRYTVTEIIISPSVKPAIFVRRERDRMFENNFIRQARVA